MAKDITIRVTGQNADGTLNVQQVDGGNPFSTQPTTGMVPYNPNAGAMQPATPTGGHRAKLNGVEITFASEADYLRADRALRELTEAQNVPQLGGRGSTGNWLRTGANAAEAVAGFLNGRNVRRKLEDLHDSLEESRELRRELDTLEAKYPDLVPTLRRLFLAERDMTETSISVLEDQLTAVDIQTGSGVAKVAADLMGPSSPLGVGVGAGAGGEGSHLNTALALGGAGLGLSLLLNNDRRERPRRSKR